MSDQERFCSCGECRQAGVTHLPMRKSPQTKDWMHGYDLKRYWAAADRFKSELAQMAKRWSETHGMSGRGRT